MTSSNQIASTGAPAPEMVSCQFFKVSVGRRTYAVSYQPGTHAQPEENELTAVLGVARDLVADLLMAA